MFGFLNRQNARFLSSDLDRRDRFNGIIQQPFAFLEPFEGGVEEAAGVVLCRVRIRACVDEFGDLLRSDFIHGDVAAKAGEAFVGQLGVPAVVGVASGLLQ